MAFRDKKSVLGNRKATNENKCYNCHKFKHFRQNCFFPSRRLNKTTQQSWREELQKKDLYKEGNSIETIVKVEVTHQIKLIRSQKIR